MEEGKLNAKIEALLNEEKQMRLAADVVGTRMVGIDIIQLCYEAKAWKTLTEQILLLSKRHSQLKQLSALLADVGLNIREAHVFSTTDGSSLGVFVVDGWPTEGVKHLKHALLQALSSMEPAAVTRPVPTLEPVPLPEPPRMLEAVPGIDDWEIDSSQLRFIRKLSTGSSGDIYQCSYCGQDVAIKVLNAGSMTEGLKLEFLQELSMMRKSETRILSSSLALAQRPRTCVLSQSTYLVGAFTTTCINKRQF